MANPFEVKQQDVVKKTQGQQPVQTTGGVSRFEQLNAYMQSMDVYSLAAGGQSFSYQNYDGFQRTTTSDDGANSSEVKNTKSALKQANADAAKSGDEAGTSMAGAKKSASRAKENKATLTNKNQEAKTRTNQASGTMTANNNQVQRLTLENDSLVSDTEDLNREIEELMAEDGETYTAPEVVNPIPAKAPAAGNSQGGDSMAAPTAASTAAPAGDNQFAMGGNNFGGAQGGNFFAMNSLPSTQQTPAPTSETAVAATRSAEGGATTTAAPAQQGQQGQQASNGRNAQGEQGGQGGRQSAPVSNPSSSRGSSLVAFASSVTKGKNGGEIAALQDKVSANQTKLLSNASTVSALNGKTTSLYKQNFNYLNGVKQTASQVNGTSVNGIKAAQTTQTIGAVTTTTGGVTTAVGVAAQAFGWTFIPGKATEIVGMGLTSTGGATTTAGQLAQGNNEGALNTANTTTSSLSNMFSKIQAAKA